MPKTATVVNAIVVYWQANPDGGTQAGVLAAMQATGLSSAQAAALGSALLQELFDHAVLNGSAYADLKTRIGVVGVLRLSRALRAAAALGPTLFDLLRKADLLGAAALLTAQVAAFDQRLSDLAAGVASAASALPAGAARAELLASADAIRLELEAARAAAAAEAARLTAEAA
jgi:hypothetical protein